MKICSTCSFKPSLLTVGKFSTQEETLVKFTRLLTIFFESIDNFSVNSLSYAVCKGLSL